MRLSFFKRRSQRQIAIPASNLVLREPTRNDAKNWIALRTESQGFLREWEPQWPIDDLSTAGYMRRLRSYARQKQNGSGFTFFLFDQRKNTLLGGLSLTRIDTTTNRSATLGYWMGKKHAGSGYMSKAVPAAVQYGFSDLKLSKIEAGCLPRNERSIRLLQKSGFEITGFSQKHLEINGKYEDHVLLTNYKDRSLMGANQVSKNAGQSSISMV